MPIAWLAHSILGVAKFTQRTFLHTACKQQEVWRFAAPAPIRFSKTGLASILTTLASRLIFIETVSAIGNAPRGKIGTRALHAGIFAMTAVGFAESS